MRKYPLLIFLAGFSFWAQAQSNKTEVLFNGKNLDGWYIINGDESIEAPLFAVVNGTIGTYPSQEALSEQPFAALVTVKEYENYTLSLEFKWGEKEFKPRDESVRDAGVLIHMYGEDVIWPAGIECQIQEGDTGDLWIIKSMASSKVDGNGNNYDPKGTLITKGEGSDYSRISRHYSWEKQGWNAIRLEVKGDQAQFFVNEKLVNEAIDMKKWDTEKEAWVPLTRGKIMIQAEGAELFYRNIRVKAF